jgi:hypothetical protein
MGLLIMKDGGISESENRIINFKACAIRFEKIKMPFRLVRITAKRA